MGSCAIVFYIVVLYWACFFHFSMIEMQTCHQTYTFQHTFPCILFSYFSIKILFSKNFKFSNKDYFTYLYIYRYDSKVTISHRMYQHNLQPMVLIPDIYTYIIRSLAMRIKLTIMKHMYIHLYFEKCTGRYFKVRDDDIYLYQ